MHAGVWQSAQHGRPPRYEDDLCNVSTPDRVFDLQGLRDDHIELHADHSGVEDGGEADGLEQEDFKVAASLPEQEGSAQ